MLGRFGSPAAMLPSALSVSSLFGNSVHHEIRLFGVQALRSSDRPLSLIGGPKSVAAVALRSEAIGQPARPPLGSLCQDRHLSRVAA